MDVSTQLLLDEILGAVRVPPTPDVPAAPHVLALTAALLRYCRRERRAYRSCLGGPDGHGYRTTAMNDAVDFLNGSVRSGEFCGPPVVDTRREWVVERLLATPPTARAVVARGIAAAFDQVYGRDQFWVLFLNDHRDEEWTPAPGDPLPRPASREMWEGVLPRPSGGPPGVMTPPASLEDDADRLPNLCLVPEGEGEWKILFNTRCAKPLKRLMGMGGRAATMNVGTALLNRQANDNPPGEIRWTKFQHNGGHYFFNVGPLDPQQQLTRMKAVVDEARRRKLDLLVFPELCIDQQGLSDLFDYYHANPGRLTLLVGGSYHTGDPLTWTPVPRNHAEAVLPRGFAHDGVRPEHQKHVAFEYGNTNNTCREWIDTTQPTIRVYLSQTWYMTLSICRDALNGPTLALLEKLNVNLLLVPAMSDVLTPFAHLLPAFLQRTWALAIVANNPAECIHPTGHLRDGHAVFGIPARDLANDVVMVRFDGQCFDGSSGHAPPQLCHMRVLSGQQNPNWVPC